MTQIEFLPFFCAEPPADRSHYTTKIKTEGGGREGGAGWGKREWKAGREGEILSRRFALYWRDCDRCARLCEALSVSLSDGLATQRQQFFVWFVCLYYFSLYHFHWFPFLFLEIFSIEYSRQTERFCFDSTLLNNRGAERKNSIIKPDRNKDWNHSLKFRFFYNQ